MKKVAFIVAGINAGGTENYLLRFIRYYQEEIKATIYCKSGKLGELEDEFINAGAELRPFYLGYLSYSKYQELKRLFNREQYDTVCDLTGSFGAFPLLMAQQAGIKKRIAFFRNAGEKFSKSFLKMQYHRFIKTLLPKVATNVLSNSKTAFNHFYKGKDWQADPRFQVIYNGIEAAAFIKDNNNLREELNISVDSFVVGHVGRYNEQKNHDTILKVALDLCKLHKDVFFILCGKNVEQAYIQRVRESGLSKQILFLGVRRDIDRVLRTMNCFYFPSTVEGQPNALIEALMVGVPFVCSDIQPIKETVPIEFYDQLVPSHDSEKAKERIMEIKNDQNKRAELNLSKWAIDYYNPEKWFQLFYDKL